MTTIFTPIMRLPEMTTGDPSVTDLWGTILSNAMPLIEQGAAGNTTISIAGLTTYTLTVANNATDQARLKLWNFTGALTANCTVTIPATARVGQVQNSTTGGFNVIVTTGSGRAVTVYPGMGYDITCDGTNVDKLPFGSDPFQVQSGSTFTLNLSQATYFLLQPNANFSINMTGLPSGNIVPSCIVTIYNGGAYTPTYGFVPRWSAGSPPVLSGLAYDVLGFFLLNGGWYGFLLGRAMS